jgi:hypothetical protein
MVWQAGILLKLDILSILYYLAFQGRAAFEKNIDLSFKLKERATGTGLDRQGQTTGHSRGMHEIHRASVKVPPLTSGGSINGS